MEVQLHFNFLGGEPSRRKRKRTPFAVGAVVAVVAATNSRRGDGRVWGRAGVWWKTLL